MFWPVALGVGQRDVAFGDLTSADGDHPRALDARVYGHVHERRNAIKHLPRRFFRVYEPLFAPLRVQVVHLLEGDVLNH